MFVEIVAGKKNVHKPVECCIIHQRGNSAPNTGIVCRRWKTPVQDLNKAFFVFYLTDLYYYQTFNSCSSSTRGAHDGSSLPPQYSSASDPSPNDPTENSPPLSLSVALQPQVVFKLGYFQISFVKKLLSFSYLPMVCSHVCHVFQVGHTMPSRKKKERKKNRMWATGEHIGQ